MLLAALLLLQGVVLPPNAATNEGSTRDFWLLNGAPTKICQRYSYNLKPFAARKLAFRYDAFQNGIDGALFTFSVWASTWDGKLGRESFPDITAMHNVVSNKKVDLPNGPHDFKMSRPFDIIIPFDRAYPHYGGPLQFVMIAEGPATNLPYHPDATENCGGSYVSCIMTDCYRCNSKINSTVKLNEDSIRVDVTDAAPGKFVFLSISNRYSGDLCFFLAKPITMMWKIATINGNATFYIPVPKENINFIFQAFEWWPNMDPWYIFNDHVGPAYSAVLNQPALPAEYIITRILNSPAGEYKKHYAIITEWGWIK